MNGFYHPKVTLVQTFGFQSKTFLLLFIFQGTVCDFRLSYGRVLNRKSKIIAVNRDRTQLLKVGILVEVVDIFFLVN